MANDINIVVSADARSATQNLQKAQSAVNNLDNRIKNSTNTLNKNAKAYNRTAVATNKWGKGALQQVGYQLGDFFVQVGGGTNKLQAFGQQGAQLAGIFGPFGAVLGAGIAIFSAVGLAAQKSGEKFLDFSTASSRAEEALQSLKKVTKEQTAELNALLSGFQNIQQLNLSNATAELERQSASLLEQLLTIRAIQVENQTPVQSTLPMGALSDAEKLSNSVSNINEKLEEARSQFKDIISNEEISQVQKLVQLTNELAIRSAGGGDLAVSMNKAAEAAKRFAQAAGESPEDIEEAGRAAAIVARKQFLAAKAIRDIKDDTNTVTREAIALQERLASINQQMLRPAQELNEIITELAIRESGGGDLEVQIERATRQAMALAIEANKNTDEINNAGKQAAITARKKFEANKRINELILGQNKGRRDAVSHQKQLLALNEKMLEPMRKLAELQRELAIRQSGGGDLGVRMAKAADGAKALAREQGTLDPTKLQEIADAAAAVERSTFFAENSISALAQNGAKALKNELDPAIQQIKSATDAISSAFENSFTSVIDGTMNVKDAFKSLALSIINDLFRIFVVKQITGFITKLFGPIDTKIVPGVGNSVGIPDKFNGGGYTGNGARAGGLDGKGGRMAMIHPRETILDHTKGQGQGVTVVQNINVSAGVAQTVRAEMTTMLPQIGEYAKAAVLDARKRGGAYGGAFA